MNRRLKRPAVNFGGVEFTPGAYIYADEDGIVVADQSTSRLTFLGKAAALVAFGIAWISASRILLIITDEGERHSLSPFQPSANPYVKLIRKVKRVTLAMINT